jgi:hypothetical protein
MKEAGENACGAADMVGNLVAKVATWCRAEAGDLYAATRIARRVADARGRAGRGRGLPGTASPAGAVGREQ